jgi:hypothetical protein
VQERAITLKVTANEGKTIVYANPSFTQNIFFLDYAYINWQDG